MVNSLPDVNQIHDSFSHCVFKRIVLHTRKKKQGLFGKGLTLSKTTKFYPVQIESISRRQVAQMVQYFFDKDRKMWEKEKYWLPGFLLFPYCF